MVAPAPFMVEPDPAATTHSSVSREPEIKKRSTPYIVLVALDLSEPGGRAWRFAFDLADLRGGETEIHAVVIGARGLSPGIKDVATPRVSTMRAEDRPTSPPPLKILEHRSAGGEARLMAMHYRDGRPDKAIVQLASEIDADLIVVAGHPPTRLERWFGGPLADRIARNAPCPVVIVRQKRDETDPGVDEYVPRSLR
ncbi:MAG: universal stress protein [Polyangiaceae bacterium]|nr:universal stress protein [Polyangiaceae bacterium]